MQSRSLNGQSVKHVSISFKDLLPFGVNIQRLYESQSESPEKLKMLSNRQSRPKIVHLSINSLMKENKFGFSERADLCFRRNKLKELSQGFKLKKEAFS
jgi:hypothetical protein